MNTVDILQTVRDAGISGLLIIALIGGFRRWWVFGWVYRETSRERDEWKQLALSGTHLSERSVQVAQKAISTASEAES